MGLDFELCFPSVLVGSVSKRLCQSEREHPVTKVNLVLTTGYPLAPGKSQRKITSVFSLIELLTGNIGVWAISYY